MFFVLFKKGMVILGLVVVKNLNRGWVLGLLIFIFLNKGKVIL